MVYAGQPEKAVHGGGGGDPCAAGRSTSYCRRCSSIMDEEEEQEVKDGDEEEVKDGDAAGPLSSGGVAGGEEEPDTARSLEEGGDAHVHQEAGEGASETAYNGGAVFSSAAAGGGGDGVSVVQVQGGDGLGRPNVLRWGDACSSHHPACFALPSLRGAVVETIAAPFLFSGVCVPFPFPFPFPRS